MQATWGQWGAQAAAAGVATNVAGFSMPPPTTGANTASTAAAGAAATPAALGAFSMGSYPLYNAQAAALNPTAMTAGATAAGVAAAGYTPQQWALAQQQNWQQWETWQQQYAQWQQQYGEKYQAHMNATLGVGAAAGMGMGMGAGAGAKPPLPTTEPQQPPPPSAAPAPPTSQYDSGTNKGLSNRNQADENFKRGFDDKDKDDSKKFKSDKASDDKSGKKETLEELAEAEKAFDQQFKNWESQFLKWKEQNINHPDKNQYKEYEAKWESWREQLLERREQMKKRREAKEASIRAAEEAAREAAAREAKKEMKNETPAVPAAVSMMGGMNAAGASSLNPAMFQMNPALNPAAAMAGFGAFSYPGYGAFPGMTVPPPIAPQNTQTAMAQFPGMGAAPVNPETNSAPLDFLKSGSKGIPGLDLVGQEDESKTDRGDLSKSGQKNNDYSGRDLNKPLTTSDDKPFQFPPPVGQMPPFMAQNFQQKAAEMGQVGMAPPFMPNMAPPNQMGANMFSAPPPDGFGFPPGKFPADGMPPTAAGAQNMFGAPNPQQMFAGMQNSGFPPGQPNANTFDQNDPQSKNYSGDKSNTYDSQNRFSRGPDSQTGSDTFRSQNNYYDTSPGSQAQRNANKAGGLLPTPAGFNQFGSGSKFNQGGPQDSSHYPDDDFDRQSNGSFNRNSFDDAEFSDSYNKFKDSSPMKPPYDSKSKPALMDSYSKGGPGSRDFGDKGFNQRSRSRFDDAPNFDGRESDSKPVSTGSLNNAGSLLRPSYLLEKKEALERIRTSAGLPPLSASSGLGSASQFSRDTPEDDFRSKGRGQFDDSRTREPFEERKDYGQFDSPNSGDRFNDFDDARGRGKFDEPRGRGKFDEPRGRGRFNEPRGRGRFDGPDRGFDSRSKFDSDNKYGDDKFGPQRPYRDENQSPGVEHGDRGGKWGRPGSFEPPPPVRPRLEVEFLRPAKVIDYNHKRIEPEFFEPVTITDYGHGIASYARSSTYDKGVRRNEYDDRNPRQRHSRSPLRRSPPHRNSPMRRSPLRRGSPGRSPHRSSYHRSPSRENRSRSPNRRNSPDRGSKKFDKDSERDSNKKTESQGDSAKQSESNHPGSQTVPAPQSVSISDLLELPGRNTRPAKIVIILRGPPGSGKSYVAKLIKDKEVEMGGTAPRILSLDDYFVTEVEKEEVDPETNKKVSVKKMEYVYESGMDQHYRSSLVKAFRKTVLDGFFPFIIVDSVFEKVNHYSEIAGFGKNKGFRPYICEMDLDVSLCLKRNIHNRTEADIQGIVNRWEKTPPSQVLLDVRPLLQSDSITEVNMEDIDDEEPEKPNEENPAAEKSEESKTDEPPEDDIPANLFTSKWELMEFNEEKKDRLDGLRKKRTSESSIRDWLQSNSASAEDDVYTSERQSMVPGKKRVRWADMEERHAVEKMRNLGFVVGQTDWSRMMDPSQAKNKLTQIKYI